MNYNTDDRLSTKLNHLVQKAVDEAIEQHRIKGESIAISENGKIKIVPPEEITPLADKLKQRAALEKYDNTLCQWLFEQAKIQDAGVHR